MHKLAPKKPLISTKNWRPPNQSNKPASHTLNMQQKFQSISPLGEGSLQPSSHGGPLLVGGKHAHEALAEEDNVAVVAKSSRSHPPWWWWSPSLDVLATHLLAVVPLLRVLWLHHGS